jgi:hypothetical protein
MIVLFHVLGQNIMVAGMYGEGTFSLDCGQEAESKDWPGDTYNLQRHVHSDLFPQTRPRYLKFP